MIETGTFTAVGSWPYKNVNKTVDLILENFKDLPAWPQLPKTNFSENMYVQYSEHLPGRVIEGDKIYIDLSKDNTQEMENFYLKMIHV